MRKYFGTDGIRGQVGKGVITPEFMLKLGWAAGKVFNGQSKNKILIGKDTRISGYMFESALEAGIVAAGADVRLVGPMPTPAIAYLTRTFRACAGIVISASHNPYTDNGIKFFSSEGGKISDELEEEIEYWLDQPMEVVESDKIGKAKRIDDAAGRYIEYCKGTFPIGLRITGLKMVLDCADGATYHVAPRVFSELGADVIVIGASPDGLNINEVSGATKPELLQKNVVAHGADIGIALDGDGDRLILVDKFGKVCDGDDVLYIIANHLSSKGQFSGGVVGTLMTNFGLELALSERGVGFSRANVGDRYVNEKLTQHGWSLGGEPSGHIVCKSITTTGDGIIAALQILQAMLEEGKPLHELLEGLVKFPQKLKNIRVKERFIPSEVPALQKAIAHANERLNGSGRVLLRASGTEPLIRVMVEGRDDELVSDLIDYLSAEVQKVI
ncbi:phosphoglucosamine mutase [Marinomonas mediterranea]|jgi:phosphoglucosamine mutase (EC 5.4.2.10)|uniref:Phosphoglucosamine mutase n=1 Tax=Marinomonas mediterranea (strain ATCC 700492 / JCM 21426 / NBRC 103028 / MMB-1) TaxID=717774 RepID=F2K4F0_MARM1|nr:phosphoglucosamine mutase [Marinomonas mediterranea]ADZ90249.1 phosphoglucosamine mutase [Marinomonas mediterranea MMB-1]WCN08310.1 phosphoglucosamine mutase [Marinomonas mediterranea]WCN16441.1 phosphoglucosamine mutase [Marinomonas mediterranea MMB-1]